MDYVSLATEAARTAGLFLKEHFGEILVIERKADASLVTNLDKEAERMITTMFRTATPELGIFAEEGGNSISGTSSYRWIIDPLDGTHNFVRGNTMYGVSIGLMRGEADFVAGVIYMPETDELYAAEAGAGAYKNGEVLRVSSNDTLAESTLLFDSGFHYGSRQRIEALEKIAHRFFNVRILGASTRNLTYLAEGKADALVEFDEKPWDFAAGAVIVREAGGEITDRDMSPITLDKTGYVASNGVLHKTILHMLE